MLQAIEHWEEFLPNMYDRLNKEETLENEAIKAAEATLNDMARLVEQGCSAESAWEQVRERYVFLPEEPEATPEEEPSEGYRIAVAANRMLRNIGQEED